MGVFISGGIDSVFERSRVPVLAVYLRALATQAEVHIFALDDRPELGTHPWHGATVQHLRGSGRHRGQLSRWCVGLALELARRRRFDVLHGFIAGPPGFIAASLGRAFRIPSVVTLMGGELSRLDDIGYGSQRHWRGRFLVNRTLAWCNHITVATRFMAVRVAGHGRKATVIPMGIDTHPSTSQRQTSDDGASWRLLHVATLCPVKDQTTLLQAVRRVRDRGLDVEIDLVGGDSMNGAVQQLAADLGLNGVHTSMGGFRARRSMATTPLRICSYCPRATTWRRWSCSRPPPEGCRPWGPTSAMSRIGRRSAQRAYRSHRPIALPMRLSDCCVTPPNGLVWGPRLEAGSRLTMCIGRSRRSASCMAGWRVRGERLLGRPWAGDHRCLPLRDPPRSRSLRL